MIVGTIVVVSTVWGFFFSRVVEIKNERIALLEQEKNTNGIGPYVKSIDERLARLSLATSIDPLDGRASFGSGASGPTAVTMLAIDIGRLQQEKKYDLIDEKLDEIEKLYPGFPGALLIRFQVCLQKGQKEEAASYAEKLLAAVSNDKRLLGAYEFLVNSKLEAGKKAEAEKLALKELRLDPANTQIREGFRKVFGYDPSVASQK